MENSHSQLQSRVRAWNQALTLQFLAVRSTQSQSKRNNNIIINDKVSTQKQRLSSPAQLHKARISLERFISKQVLQKAKDLYC